MKTVLALAFLVPVSALAGDIEVDIALTKTGGVVRCALFADAAAFPETIEKAKERQEGTAIEKGRSSCRFENVEPGTYAVSVLHDVNGNQDLDVNLLGIPKEPLGFSNGAKASFGPPKFDAAKFTHGAEATRLSITAK